MERQGHLTRGIPRNVESILVGMPEQEEVALNTFFHRQCKTTNHALAYDLLVFERLPLAERTYEVLRGHVVRFLTKSRDGRNRAQIVGAIQNASLAAAAA